MTGRVNSELQLLATKNIQFRFENSVDEMMGDGDKLREVRLTDGEVLPADLCVMGVGWWDNDILLEWLYHLFFGDFL